MTAQITMLIFNCSKSFAAFIEPKAKAGEPPLVVLPPSPEEEAEAQLSVSPTKQERILQWAVHMVRIRRKPCVLVMEAETRYAMIFTGLKKGDPTEFIGEMIMRLTNEMAFAAADLSVMADFSSMTASFLDQHRTFRFFLRSDRSVQTHLNDVAWHLHDQAAMAQGLPGGHEECGMFDEFINDTLRSTKSRKDYFVPAEEMLISWLTHCAGLTAQGEAKLRETLRARKRRYIEDLINQKE